MRTRHSNVRLLSLIAAGTLAAFVPWARLARHVFPPPPALAGSVHVQEPPGGLRQIAIKLLIAKQLREIQRQANAYQTSLFVDEARKAKAGNDYAEALGLYNQALAFDPADAAAVAGRREIRAYLGQDPDKEPEDVFHSSTQRDQLTFDYETAVKDAVEAIGRGDLAEAGIFIERGRAAAATNPGIFSPAEIRRFDARLADLRKRLDEARGAAAGNRPPPDAGEKRQAGAAGG